MDENLTLPRVTLDTHPIVCVLDAAVIEPDLWTQQPAVKLADHVVQLLAGVGHLVDHPEQRVTTLSRTLKIAQYSVSWSWHMSILSMCDQSCHYGWPRWPCRGPACPTAPAPPCPRRWPWPESSSRLCCASSAPSLGMSANVNMYVLYNYVKSVQGIDQTTWDFFPLDQNSVIWRSAIFATSIWICCFEASPVCSSSVPLLAEVVLIVVVTFVSILKNWAQMSISVPEGCAIIHGNTKHK